jgi:GGDEF domain-containing protein
MNNNEKLSEAGTNGLELIALARGDGPGSDHLPAVAWRAGEGQPAVRGLPSLATYVVDPITQLVAFPNFDASFPDLVNEAFASGREIGVAVGDVDDMKSYVEGERAADELCFGHLAGNALMAQLGAVALRWFGAADIGSGCLSTFGGDEIVLLAVSESVGQRFDEQVLALRQELSTALPCTVSFAYGVFTGRSRLERLPGTQCRRALVAVDRALFELKRKRNGGSGESILAIGHQGASGDGWEALAAPEEGLMPHAGTATCR